MDVIWKLLLARRFQAATRLERMCGLESAVKQQSSSSNRTQSSATFDRMIHRIQSIRRISSTPHLLQSQGRGGLARTTGQRPVTHARADTCTRTCTSTRTRTHPLTHSLTIHSLPSSLTQSLTRAHCYQMLFVCDVALYVKARFFRTCAWIGHRATQRPRTSGEGCCCEL